MTGQISPSKQEETQQVKENDIQKAHANDKNEK